MFGDEPNGLIVLLTSQTDADVHTGREGAHRPANPELHVHLKSREIRGPSKPVHLRALGTHIHLHAASSPGIRSLGRLGSQQVQSRGAHWVVA